MIPVKRNIKFTLPRTQRGQFRLWHKDGAHATLFFNLLSLYLPSAEMFVIATVRNARDSGMITDPQLLEEINGLIAQEAIHAREHVQYNEGVKNAYFGARLIDAIVVDFINSGSKNLSPQMMAACTAAAEHLTGCLADAALLGTGVLDRAEQPFQDLWRWHGEEEVEHKAVSHDVYQAVMGTGIKAYALRTSTTAVITVAFWASVLIFYSFLVLQDRSLRNDRDGMRALYQMLFGKPGILKRWMGPYLSGYRPDYHPWQHDTRHLLGKADEIMRARAVA